MSGQAVNGRVAVVIPVYRAEFLAAALESVFRQSRQPDEVIVINDGSPDQADLDRALAPWGDLVRLICQENAGAGAARNRGLNATTAEFVALLDADDEWLPTLLEEQLALFDRRPELDLVYSDGLFIGRSELAGRRYMSACPSTGEVSFERLLSQQCTILLSSVVARRAAVQAVGGFDVTLRRGQDFDLWLRMARAGARMSYQTTVLTHRRMHSHNLSGTPVDELERPLRVFERVLMTMPLTDQQRLIVQRRMDALTSSLARERGKEMLRSGDWSGARRALLDACRRDGTWKLVAALFGLHLAPHLVRQLYLSRHPATGAAGKGQLTQPLRRARSMVRP